MQLFDLVAQARRCRRRCGSRRRRPRAALARVACAASMRSASSRVVPSRAMRRASCSSGSQSTTSTRSKRVRAAGFDEQRDRDDDVGAACRVAALIGELRGWPGCVSCFEPRAARRIGEYPRAQLAAIEAAVALRALRRRNARRSARSSGEPGATTSRASRSVSTMGTPSAANRLATVVLPQAMPPVSPMRNRRGIGSARARTARGSGRRRRGRRAAKSQPAMARNGPKAICVSMPLRWR